VENSSGLSSRLTGTTPARTSGPFKDSVRVPAWTHTDLQLARMTNANLLIIGTEGLVLHLIKSLIPDLIKATVVRCRGERLLLPPASALVATMVLRDVDALADEEQRALLEWFRSASGLTQVVSTSSVPLWPLVEAGVFSDVLYYRLNTVCIDLSE
jgi:hypothetical protein